MTPQSSQPLTREQMAWRAAQDLPEGAYVNLGSTHRGRLRQAHLHQPRGDRCDPARTEPKLQLASHWQALAPPEGPEARAA